MKTEIRLNLIGLERDEIKEAITKASIELGIPERLMKNFQYHAKTFIQRRKIGGREALLYVALMPSHEAAGASLYPMTAGLGLSQGMLILTPEDNGSTMSETVSLFRKSYDKVGDALAAFEGSVVIFQHENAQLEAPVAPIVNKKNYDVIEAVSQPAQKAQKAAYDLTELLHLARQQALNFCPNELLTGVLADIDTLQTSVFALRRKADQIVEEHYQILKNL